MPEVIIQQWEESERGWGVRPDGFSIHLSMEECRRFRDEFWEKQRARDGGVVPESYSRESGEPFAVEISKNEYKKIKTKIDSDNHGVWGRGSACPSTHLATEGLM